MRSKTVCCTEQKHRGSQKNIREFETAEMNGLRGSVLNGRFKASEENYAVGTNKLRKEWRTKEIVKGRSNNGINCKSLDT